MSGIFPNHDDGGLPPNSSDPSNPKAAYAPVTPPLNTGALYYGNGCDVRLRPEVINSLISELEAIADQAGVPYDQSRRENCELAIRYMIQRGIPRQVYLSGGPNAYTGVLDPTITAYNNFMTLTIIPQVTNKAVVTVNLDNRGVCYVLRNDGQHLEAGDLRISMPYIVAWVGGNFYLCSLANSQVPLLIKGGIDVWIRTDGNDATGDGSANTPESAYRTIQGAWWGVGYRYAATPLFAINMKFGIPGDYEGAIIGPFGGNVSLTGNLDDAAAYRVHCVYYDPVSYGLWIHGISNFTAHGITFDMDIANNAATSAVRCINSHCMFSECRFIATVNNVNGYLVEINLGGQFVGAPAYDSVTGEPRASTTLVFDGINHTIGGVFTIGLHGELVGAYRASWQTVTYEISNMTCSVATIAVSGLGIAHWVVISNITGGSVGGPQYWISQNSILHSGGKPIPGSVGGSSFTGAQFIP